MSLIINVVNKHHGDTGEYIGRGSPLGNPYSHMKGTKAEYLVEDREMAVMCYRHWIGRQIDEGNPAVINELERLYQLAKQGPLNLLCFCAPKVCHGHFIRDLLFQAHDNETQDGDD